MNRRSFFGRLVASGATIYAAPVAAQALKVDLARDVLVPETYPVNLALANVVPICPRCGNVLIVDYRGWPSSPDDVLALLPAHCSSPCGWEGVSPRAMRITR